MLFYRSISGASSTTSTEDFIIIDMKKQREDPIVGEDNDHNYCNYNNDKIKSITFGEGNFWYRGQTETLKIHDKNNRFQCMENDVYY